MEPPQLVETEDAMENNQRDILYRIEEERNHDALEEVLAATRSSSDNIRSVAGDVLAVLGRTAEEKERIGRALLALLQDDVDFVRTPAIEALGLQRYKPACLPLSRLLLEDPESLVRICAAEALGSIGDPAAIPALIAAMVDPVYVVRRYAVESIGLLGATEHIPICLEQAEKNREIAPDVALQALFASYRLGQRSVLIQIDAWLDGWWGMPSFWEDDITYPFGNMLKALLEESPPAYLEEDREPLDRIHEKIERFEWKTSRLSTMRYSVKRQGERGLSSLFLAKLLPRHIEWGTEAMQRCAFPAAWVSQAVDLMRLAAGDGPAEGGLQRALDGISSPVEEIRVCAAEALSVLGNTPQHREATAHVLLGALSDPADEVRRAAVEALGAWRYQPARDQLVEILRTDPNDLVRTSAAEALGDVGDAAILPALLAALADDSSLVRQYAVASVGLLGSVEHRAVCQQLAQAEKTDENECQLVIEASLASYRLGDRDSLVQLESWMAASGFVKPLYGKVLMNMLDFLRTERPPAYLDQDREQWDRLYAKAEVLDESFRRKIGVKSPESTQST